MTEDKLKKERFSTLSKDISKLDSRVSGLKDSANRVFDNIHESIAEIELRITEIETFEAKIAEKIGFILGVMKNFNMIERIEE